MRLKTLLVLLYLMGLTFSFLMGCNKLTLFGGTDYSAFSQLPSWDENEGSIPNDKFFYIRLARDNYAGHSFLQHALYELDAGPGTDCKIPIDQESSEDIFCQLEKIEGDLWAHDTLVEYNVPPGMCDYLSLQVPWHFNQNAGYGPRYVSKCEEITPSHSDEENEETEDKYCIGQSCPSGCRTGSCGSNCATQVEDLCGYDLSHTDDFANCCIGDYEVSGEDQSDGSWGESLAQCLGGLGRINWNVRDKLGIPQLLMHSVEKDGYIDTYEIPSIESFYDGGFIETNGISGPSFAVANYYEDIEEFNLGNLPKLYETEAPYRIVLDQSGRSIRIQQPYRGGSSLLFKGYPYLTWSCLDNAHEVIHRIHLIIREWNTEEEFNKFVESNGSRGDPDVGGEEGTDCEYYSLPDHITGVDRDTFAFRACDDAADLDDWIKRSSISPHPHVIYNR